MDREQRLTIANEMAIVYKLSRAFCDHSFFDISAVHRACEAKGLKWNGTQHYKMLEPFHCNDWRSMDADVKKMLVEITCELCLIDPVSINRFLPNHVKWPSKLARIFRRRDGYYGFDFPH